MVSLNAEPQLVQLKLRAVSVVEVNAMAIA